jgi:cyanophycin synthetase
MKLLEQGAIEGGADPERVHLIATEEGATAAALMAARTSDLLVVTPTDVNGTWQLITSFERVETATSKRPSQMAAAE